MKTPGEVIKTLLPEVTDHGLCPSWPPDVFAVAATIGLRSGTYARQLREVPSEEREERIQRAINAGRRWRSTLRPPEEAVWRWEWILARRDVLLSDRSCWESNESLEMVGGLMVIADEACAGVGFPSSGEDLVADALRVKRVDGQPLEDVRRTICFKVPHYVACVQPKALTPTVGMTLRTRSRHVALLPSSAEIDTEWPSYAVDATAEPREALRLVIAPLPYSVPVTAFKKTNNGRLGRYFKFDPECCHPDGEASLGKFLRDLVREARRGGTVDGLMLPELALPDSWEGTIETVAKEEGLPLLVAGLATKTENVALVSAKAPEERGWRQNKQHRWRLTPDQIRRYGLGARLDPGVEWWEDIVVGKRAIRFGRLADRVLFGVLICEDLARIDLAQEVLRAIGPNLLLVPVLDGPQRPDRWTARYATTYSDDPGTAVLTLTSLGMLRRGHAPGREPRSVALWRDHLEGDSRVLELPRGYHALALNLRLSSEQSKTSDGRKRDGRECVRVTLEDIDYVRVDDTRGWADTR